MRPGVALLCLAGCFLLSSLGLFAISQCLPALHDRYVLRFPNSLEQLKELATFLKEYKAEHEVWVLVLFCAAYLYKQTFAIPGSVFMNLLGGALFDIQYAFPLACLLTACGATNCYLLSKIFGRSILIHYFPDKLKALEAKVKENEDGMFFFLLCLRLFPMSPNWFLNMASPLLGIPITYFFPTVFIGLIPYNFMCVQTGSILSELSSMSDIFTPVVFMKLVVVAVVVALPGVVVKVTRRTNKNE